MYVYGLSSIKVYLQWFLGWVYRNVNDKLTSARALTSAVLACAFGVLNKQSNLICYQVMFQAVGRMFTCV